MIYLQKFCLLSEDAEWEFLSNMYRTCYDSYYPFSFFPKMKGLSEVDFLDITILSGGNGSGKSTLLNIIAEKLELGRETVYNKTDFFDQYVDRCYYQMSTYNPEATRDLMKVSRIITSDDVFSHIIGVRERNENISFKRDLIFNMGIPEPREINMEDPKSIKAYHDYYNFTRQSRSKFVRNNVGVDERTYSNGENGFKYFTDAIKPGGLYLLDEPENSLSVEMQLELVQYVQAMARFYNCQFIMSTHSPFFLSIPFAKIYNMDEFPVKTVKWTELPSVRVFYEFFRDRKDEFE